MAKLSYKVSYYVLYVMFAAILVVLGLFYFGGDAQGDAVLMSVDSEMWICFLHMCGQITMCFRN